MKRTDRNGLARGKAHYLFYEAALGGTYLVKDEDGTCYIVDHGAGELAKENGHWIDTDGPDSQEFSFQEAKHDFDIVSWSDEEPLDIWDYLKDNGWIQPNNEFVE